MDLFLEIAKNALITLAFFAYFAIPAAIGLFIVALAFSPISERPPVVQRDPVAEKEGYSSLSYLDDDEEDEDEDEEDDE